MARICQRLPLATIKALATFEAFSDFQSQTRTTMARDYASRHVTEKRTQKIPLEKTSGFFVSERLGVSPALFVWIVRAGRRPCIRRAVPRIS